MAQKPVAHAPAQTPKTILRHLGGLGDGAIRAKAAAIVANVIRPALDPKNPQGLTYTRGLLAQALNRTPRQVNGHAKPQEAKAIFHWVQSRLRYVNDPQRRELFTQLPLLMQRQIGDCDDFAALLAAMFLAAGIPAKLRVIQTKGAKGFNHIYTLGLLPVGRDPITKKARMAWVPFDATEPQRPGWEYPGAVRRLDFEVKA